MGKWQRQWLEIQRREAQRQAEAIRRQLEQQR